MRGFVVFCLVFVVFLASTCFTFRPLQAAPGANGEAEFLNLYFGEEQLVEAATHYPKPVSQVAENVEIITAEEIEAMNAHNLAEVLEEAAGLFVVWLGNDFAARSSVNIHRSEYEHVLLLLDGVRWNHPSNDFLVTNTIPVRIIDRIEIIKGAASSTWGSALGGVINVITKKTGSTARPKANLSGSYGERNSQDYNGDAFGKLGPLGYYLFAGTQNSDGIELERFVDKDQVYGKFSVALPRSTDLTLTGGYTENDDHYINFAQWDYSVVASDRMAFGSATLDSMLSENLSLSVTANAFDNQVTNHERFASTGELFARTSFDGEAHGAMGRLAWLHGVHTMVIGAEIERRSSTPSDELNDVEGNTAREEVWSIYINDTVHKGQLTVTPGLRYDHHSIADEILNPSIGATFMLRDDTLLRAGISRGYRKAALNIKKGDPDFDLVNPDLDHETIWTYQAGIETSALRYCRVKATAFLHDADDTWNQDPDTGVYANGGTDRRTGFEAEIETVPFHNVSLRANVTYVRLDLDEAGEDDTYSANVVFRYNDKKGLDARIFGRYVWYDSIATSPDDFNGSFDDMIWNATINKKLFARKGVETAVFFTARNIFSGEQFHDEVFPNAERWIEGGVKVHF